MIEELKKQILFQYGATPLTNENYGKIITQKHFDRICGLIDSDKIVHGGKTDEAALKIEPTVMDNVTFDDAVMKEEIFGPVLPIVTYDSLEHAITKINCMEHPLALYLFTSDKKIAKQVTSECQFGGGCINDVVIHLATNQMGFGGFGESGKGSYHGKAGCETFSHYKSMVDKKTWIDLPMRYQPYKEFNRKLLKLFLK